MPGAQLATYIDQCFRNVLAVLEQPAPPRVDIEMRNDCCAQFLVHRRLLLRRDKAVCGVEQGHAHNATPAVTASSAPSPLTARHCVRDTPIVGLRAAPSPLTAHTAWQVWSALMHLTLQPQCNPGQPPDADELFWRPPEGYAEPPAAMNFASEHLNHVVYGFHNVFGSGGDEWRHLGSCKIPGSTIEELNRERGLDAQRPQLPK